MSVWNFSDIDLTVKWNLDCYSKRSELRTDPTLLSHVQEYCSWRHHEDGWRSAMTLPSDLSTGSFYFLPWTPAAGGFSSSLITCLSVSSFENAGFVEAWTLRCLLTPKIVPDMADWLIGSISTECTDLASEKWNRAGSLTFSQRIQPASPSVTYSWSGSMSKGMLGQMHFRWFVFLHPSKCQCNIKKNTYRSLITLLCSACSRNTYVCFLFIHPVFLYADISKFTYKSSYPSLSYIKVPYSLHCPPPCFLHLAMNLDIIPHQNTDLSHSLLTTALYTYTTLQPLPYDWWHWVASDVLALYTVSVITLYRCHFIIWAGVMYREDSQDRTAHL